MKDLFDAARYRALADELAALSPVFDRGRFLKHALADLESRELMDRMRRTSEAVALALPLSYREQLAVLYALAPRLGHGFISIFLADFVAQYGLDDFPTSLDALKFFTRFGSSEFAIRPFLLRDLAGTLAVMETWSRDADEHVRRLASEGCRPRLPWGRRLAALINDPNPVAPILENLKADPSLYVRKSVANHLNDIAKDHPDWMLARVGSWDLASPGTAWIVKHSLRTLVKRGHPAALALLGVGAAPRLTVDAFTASPRRLALGGTLQLTATLTSSARKTQSLAVDYVLHYVKAGGGTSAKVFKWKLVSLPAGATITLTKRQQVRDFTTRRHHAGVHRIELQINGLRLAETVFTLAR